MRLCPCRKTATTFGIHCRSITPMAKSFMAGGNRQVSYCGLSSPLPHRSLQVPWPHSQQTGLFPERSRVRSRGDRLLQDGVERMILRCLRTDQKHEVVNPQLSDDEMTQVQDEVFNVLGWK